MSGKRTKYKSTYCQKDMDEALSMVRENRISVRGASREYNIPKTTMLDKLHGRVSDNAKAGRSPVLSQSEEILLVDWAVNMCKIGYGRTKQELLLTVKKILDFEERATRFKNNLPGKQWFYDFLKRHQTLSIRSSQMLGRERAVITESSVKKWFDDLKCFFEGEVEEGMAVFNDPSRLYNADETGCPLEPPSGKVLALRGAKFIYKTGSSDKTQITVLACMSATAHFLPPMIVYPGERFRGYNPLNEFEDAILGRSKSGWMDSELFLAWLRDHFIPIINARKVTKPVVLFVDGHSSHINLQVAQLCRDEGIILYCLLEHASHLMQPCDVGLFGPLKKSWRDAVKEFQINHPGDFVTKQTFAGVFKTAWENAANVNSSIKGFKNSGLYPLNMSNIDTSKLAPSSVFQDLPNESLSGDDPNGSIDQSIVTDTSVDTIVTDIYIEKIESSTIDNINSSTIDSMDSSTVDKTDSSTTNEELMDVGIETASNMAVATKIIVANTDEPHMTQEKEKSESFSHVLTLPNKNKKTPSKPKLPKAISGKDMILFLEERNRKKEDEVKQKELRKVLREQKRKEKLALKEQKQKEREMRKKSKESQMSKGKNKRKRNTDIEEKSDSEDESELDLHEEDVEDDNDKMMDVVDEMCAKCGGPDDDIMENWICCEMCGRWLHRTCCGIDFSGIDEEDIINFPYECDYC